MDDLNTEILNKIDRISALEKEIENIKKSTSSELTSIKKSLEILEYQFREHTWDCDYFYECLGCGITKEENISVI